MARGNQPSSYNQAFEILWQLAVEEYPSWSHDRKRAWAISTANRLYAENAAAQALPRAHR